MHWGSYENMKLNKWLTTFKTAFHITKKDQAERIPYKWHQKNKFTSYYLITGKQIGWYLFFIEVCTNSWKTDGCDFRSQESQEDGRWRTFRSVWCSLYTYQSFLFLYCKFIHFLAQLYILQTWALKAFKLFLVNVF